jgi:hypothetical protein
MSDDKKTYDKVATFIKEHGQFNEKQTVYSMKQKDYEDLAKSYGITKEMLDTQAGFQNDVWNGMLTLSTELLETKIKEAKKAGNDPKDESVSVGVTTKAGNMRVTQDAYKEHNNPQSTDSSKTKVYGSGRLKLICKSKIDKDHLSSLQSRIQKMMDK